jgi:hypothetical protein
MILRPFLIKVNAPHGTTEKRTSPPGNLGPIQKAARGGYLMGATGFPFIRARIRVRAGTICGDDMHSTLRRKAPYLMARE